MSNNSLESFESARKWLNKYQSVIKLLGGEVSLECLNVNDSLTLVINIEKSSSSSKEVLSFFKYVTQNMTKNMTLKHNAKYIIKSNVSNVHVNFRTPLENNYKYYNQKIEGSILVKMYSYLSLLTMNMRVG